ncbi:alpha/beta fold hydrolase [Methylobacterium sp. ap11]|uniref:alpha/beta fold hydrolase n=1 Tax=Methylobacterium sp. ap11 TaxID=1761799 RepID=UPI0015A61BDA|nr:alpha/beta fold hydrolase [Methylobacterium sp. ap11]
MYSGLHVNVIRTGPRGGAPILFIHAVSLDLTWWDHQFAAYGMDHDLVAFDLPGHGASPRLDGSYTFDALATVTANVITALDTGSAHVVGISVGGMIAQTLALVRPDLVRSLTLVATLCTLTDPVREAMRERARVARADGMAAIVSPTLERWFPASFRARRPDVLDRAAKIVLRHDPAVYAEMWEMIADLDLEARIPTIACPTLVVAGAQDVNAPVAAGQKIADRIPGASLHVLPGVGHFPPLEAPHAFNERLRVHLEGNRSRCPTGNFDPLRSIARPR